VKKIITPLTPETVASLRSGDAVAIDGVIYVGRDAAHKRMVEGLDRDGKLPFDAKNQIIYYMGPSPAKPGQPIGAAGPTTSYRMDAYAPRLMAEGLIGMIGKGNRSASVKEAIKQYKGVYFASIGGAGALLSKAIQKADPVAYEDLGAEALLRLEVEGFPVVVVNDMYGGDLYEEGKKKWRIE
jgi:fumarate hydratase subunit beta